MDRLAHPELIHLVPLLPAIVGVAMLLYARRRRQVARALGETGVVRRLTAADLTAAPNRRIFLVCVAALMLGIALAGPLWGVVPTEGETGTADVVLVIDASNSMRVRDVRPDRLAWEKTAARELLRRLDGARIGMTVFAGRGYAVSPLTTDYGALELYLDGLSPDVVTQGGTSLSDAIEQSLGLLMEARDEGPSGTMILLTDGDALEERDDVLRAAGTARRVGVAVNAIGIGTQGGGPIPDVDPVSGRQVGWKRELTGETAVSRRGDALLAEVAKVTGGAYLTADAPDAVARITAAARAAPARARRAGGGNTPANRYEWFAAMALLLLAVDALVPERAQRRRRSPAAETAR